MYLLNYDRINTVAEEPDSELQIYGYDEKQLYHTFYYIRLGWGKFERHLDDDGWTSEKHAEGDALSLEGGDCIRVDSLERFALNERVLGVLGSVSELAGRGIGLLHGPFVDPLFPNAHVQRGLREPAKSLRLVLVNHLRTTQELVCGQDVIAKICFFDVSDTYPVRASPDWLSDRR